jgi:hypothetical protein
MRHAFAGRIQFMDRGYLNLVAKKAQFGGEPMASRTEEKQMATWNSCRFPGGDPPTPKAFISVRHK